MNAPPDTATRGGAFLALALADALTLGLPDPDYITMSPTLAGSTTTSAAGFQFNALHGQDPLPAMQAWASRFGVTVTVKASSDDPSTTWHEFDFTHAGVRIHAYASITAACADPCACGHAGDSHWEVAEPDGTRVGCGNAGCKCQAYAAPVVRVIADEDGGCLMPSPTGSTECMRTAGHDVILGTPHRNDGGDQWDDTGWLPAVPQTQVIR